MHFFHRRKNHFVHTELAYPSSVSAPFWRLPGRYRTVTNVPMSMGRGQFCPPTLQPPDPTQSIPLTNRSDTCHPLPIQFGPEFWLGSPPTRYQRRYRYVTGTCRKSLPHQLWTKLGIDVVDACVICWCCFHFPEWSKLAAGWPRPCICRSKFWIRLEAYHPFIGFMTFRPFLACDQRKEKTWWWVVIYEFAGTKWEAFIVIGKVFEK